MFVKKWCAMGLAAWLGTTATTQAQGIFGSTQPSPPAASPVVTQPVILSQQPAITAPAAAPARQPAALATQAAPGQPVILAQEPAPGGAGGQPEETRSQLFEAEAGTPEAPPALGPAPLLGVGILQNLIYGDNAKDAPIKFAGWLDADYTYRSTGTGQNNIAPVMNRFGDEFLARQIGLYVYKALDPKDWSWGFNAIFIGGADASFLGPTAGGWANTNPRFGGQFTDLNLTAHVPFLTEGGVDVKAGRQTTILGPMGALAWQRPLDSSDYAWYNMEEGRYTGVSTIWHISKQLDWYNGVEIGGWGVFFDDPARAVDYITNMSYWIDEDAKKTKVWFTVLTGPTGFFNHGGNTTVAEVGLLHNWNKYIYQIVDTQIVYSKAPLFFQPAPGYQERAYDVYTYVGVHLSEMVDVTTRVEWYKDVDGGGYAGGFGIPHTTYFETTLGLNYHPVKWLEFRPEIRYDNASHDAFGSKMDKENQLSIAAEVLVKF